MNASYNFTRLNSPSISCVGFCPALITRKFISPPGDKYLEKKLLLNVDYAITLRSVDDHNAFIAHELQPTFTMIGMLSKTGFVKDTNAHRP